MNWRIMGIGLAMLAVVIFGFSLAEPLSGNEVSASTQLVIPKADRSGFAQAFEAWDWQFPRDHGPHPEYLSEWWYYTGNLANEDGDLFGFQFTIFRRSISPESYQTDSEWRTDQIYMAHFTVSDVANEDFYHEERFSRGGAGLAGAEIDPTLRVWLEDWEIFGLDDEVTLQSINAKTDDVELNIQLEQVKAPTFQGEGGLSPKSDEPGNASHYYSLTRLVTDGTLTIGNTTYDVTGNTWMDREFSTSALGDDATGWDWFGLIFDDNTELMIGQIRQTDGTTRGYGSSLTLPDGSKRALDFEEYTITATDTWVSPHSDVEYPSGWIIEIEGENAGDDTIVFTVTPLQKDQELYDAGIQYWEGAVRIEGDFTGYGYAELTGYDQSIQGRF